MNLINFGIPMKNKFKAIFFEKKTTEKEAMQYGTFRLLALITVFLIIAYLLGMLFFSGEPIISIIVMGSYFLVVGIIAIPTALLTVALCFAFIGKIVLALGGKGD